MNRFSYLGIKLVVLMKISTVNWDSFGMLLSKEQNNVKTSLSTVALQQWRQKKAKIVNKDCWGFFIAYIKVDNLQRYKYCTWNSMLMTVWVKLQCQGLTSFHWIGHKADLVT